MRYQVIDPINIFVEPKKLVRYDALWPRWWHKFIFWKKWVYPDYIVKREWKGIDYFEPKKKLHKHLPTPTQDKP